MNANINSNTNSNSVFTPVRAVLCRAAATLRAEPCASANSVSRPCVPLLLRSFLLLSLALIAGCGGGPSPSGTSATKGIGRMQVTVIWPPYQSSAPTDSGKAASRQAGTHSSRYIAPNATRIQITVTDNFPTMGHIQTHGLTRQDTSYTFTGLPAGDLPVFVQEYDDNASLTEPVAVSSGSDTIHIVDATVVILPPIAPGTTVDHVAVSGPNTLAVGASGVVTASARDNRPNGGNIVPVPVGAITFMSSDSANAPVDANGNVTASKAESVTITATIAIPGAAIPTPTATKTIQVNISSVQVSPPAVTLAVLSTPNYNNQQTFTATVPGDNGTVTGVTWSILDSHGMLTNAGGTLSSTTAPSTVYTAPNSGIAGSNVSGVYYVRATSNQNPSIHSDAQVTVLSGNAQVNVN